MTVDVAVLEQAKGLLYSQGWGQGELVCDSGKVCALGALHLALGATIKEVQSDGIGGSVDPYTYFDIEYPFDALRPEHWSFGNPDYVAFQEARREWQETARPYEHALDRAVKEISDYTTHYVVDWNDMNAKTVEDVARVFDKAIENVKSEELVSV